MREPVAPVLPKIEYDRPDDDALPKGTPPRKVCQQYIIQMDAVEHQSLEIVPRPEFYSSKICAVLKDGPRGA